MTAHARRPQYSRGNGSSDGTAEEIRSRPVVYLGEKRRGVSNARNRGIAESRGEILADWVLEGRAIQDIWMTPPRSERRPGEPLPQLPVTGAWYGTTLRVYDPKLGAWHILWSDPATQFYARQIGRPEGDQIVQLGTLPSGAMLRWRFTEIETDSFHWLGEISTDKGATWRLQVEVFARRAAAT